MLAQGFLLAGGKSTRMGTDKAFLAYGGRSFLERSIGILQTVGLHVSVVTGSPSVRLSSLANRLQVPVLVDRISGAGPLGGILTALEATSSEDNYFLPCDTPLMKARFFQLLTSFAEDFDAVLARDSQGRTHPLCAYYSRRCLAPTRHLLKSGQRKVELLVEEEDVTSLVLSAPELGIPDSFFFNVNTPDDLSSLSDLEQA